MTPSTLAAFLAQQPMFTGLSEADLRHVAERMELVSGEEGDAVFEEGDEGDAWYVVLQGGVTIVRALEAGEHELARLEQGEGFGELALLDGAPRLGSALLDEDTMLASLSRTAFHALIDENPAVGARLVLAMARVVSQRQRELTAILTDLVDNPETAPPGPREMLALLIGTSAPVAGPTGEA